MADPDVPGTEVADALAGWSALATPGAAAGVYAALVDASLLLAVHSRVVSEHVVGLTGLPAEKEAELSVLTVELGDGRRVLPAFSSAAAMARWRIGARPIQVPVRDACRAALDEAWTGLIVDPGGPGFVIGRDAMTALADGFVPVAGGESMAVGEQAGGALLPDEVATAPADTLAALRRGLAREPAVAAGWLLRGPPGLEVGLELRAPMDASGLATITGRLAERLGDRRAGGSFTMVALDRASAADAALRCPRLWP